VNQKVGFRQVRRLAVLDIEDRLVDASPAG
jgi:hypothetical protein